VKFPYSAIVSNEFNSPKLMLGEQSLFIILHKISKITKTFLGKFWEKYIAFSQLHYNYWKQNTFFCSDRKSAQNNCDGVLQAEGKKFPFFKNCLPQR